MSEDRSILKVLLNSQHAGRRPWVLSSGSLPCWRTCGDPRCRPRLPAYAATVPVFESLEDYRPVVGTKIYSADDQLIGEFAHQRRVVVPIERIPRMLSQAFISAEDKRFYIHGGIDFIGVAQAIAAKVMNPSSKLRGASTITQQVAKSVLATYESYEKATERTLERKIREAILARNIEGVLTKDEILFIYMNEIFLGHKAYGVQAAAEHYFRKNVWELSLAEMATFAGLPQRPSDYSPYSRPEAALARRKYVLRRLMEDGHITQAEEAEAVQEELQVFPRHELYLDRAPYFTEQIRRMLVDRYGERAVLEDGLEVYTTLNLEAQVGAQDAINRGLLELDQRQDFEGRYSTSQMPEPGRISLSDIENIRAWKVSRNRNSNQERSTRLLWKGLLAVGAWPRSMFSGHRDFCRWLVCVGPEAPTQPNW